MIYVNIIYSKGYITCHYFILFYTNNINNNRIFIQNDPKKSRDVEKSLKKLQNQIRYII